MRHFGWGEPDHASEGLPEHAAAMLERELDLPAGGARRVPVALDAVRVGASVLPDPVRAKLAGAVGPDAVRDDHDARVLHAAGKAYPDLVRLRAGDALAAPDAVVAPPDAAAVPRVLAACAAHGVAVVPFGGGTSVVGGVEPVRGPFAAVVALDLRGLDGVIGVDERSLLASVEPGLRLPDLDAALARRGLTLGHVPQSYAFATVGGCVATRSAGQASTGFGRIDALVDGVRLDAPAGALDLAPRPASAAGPDLRELVVGSEGTLGVIMRCDLRVRRVPAATRYEGFAFGSFADGADALRAAAQGGTAPDVARLSDADETRLTLAMSGLGPVSGALVRGFLRARGVAGGCLAVCGWEGGEDDVARRRARTAAVLRAHGAVPLGTAPGRAWQRGRYDAPHLRDALLDRGVLVETLETATTWTGLEALHARVGAALRGALERPLVLCHVSHLYPSGGSLYFTFLARRDDADPIGQWRRAKRAATDAVVAGGGTITHHHAVGRDHAEWLPAEVGALGIRALRALKAELDPAGIMNPGKLLPAAP